MIRRLALLAAALVLGACRGSAPVKKAEPPPPPSPMAKAIIRTAKSYLPEEESKRKVPNDCSDFVSKVFFENGIKLPRTSEEMSVAGKRVGSSRDLRMGDLVFFSEQQISRIVGHVGIYVGKGLFIHLTRPQDGVTMDSMYDDYYRKRYLSGRRVLP